MAVDFALSPDGIESQFATNHAAHWLFTNSIMDKIGALFSFKLRAEPMLTSLPVAFLLGLVGVPSGELLRLRRRFEPEAPPEDPDPRNVSHSFED